MYSIRCEERLVAMSNTLHEQRADTEAGNTQHKKELQTMEELLNGR